MIQNTGLSLSAGLVTLQFQDLKQAISVLKKENVKIELGPVKREGALGKITSVYFRDPDVNLVEVASYEVEDAKLVQ